MQKKPSQYSIEAVFLFLALFSFGVVFFGRDIFQVPLRRYFLSQVMR